MKRYVGSMYLMLITLFYAGSDGVKITAGVARSGGSVGVRMGRAERAAKYRGGMAARWRISSSWHP